MAAPPGQPDVIRIEMAFGNNPLDPSYTWTDVTTYCQSFHTKRGRQHELSRVEAGQFSGLFTNRDARWYAWNTNSPYYPNLKVMVPLRVRATYSATTYNVWQGFVTAYRNVWSDAANTEMTIEATDGFRALDLLTVQSPYYYEVLADTPSEWYRLQEAQGTSAALDSSGNGRSGIYSAVGVTTGATSPIADSTAKAITLDGTSGNVSIPSMVISGAFSAEAWVNTTSGAAQVPILQGIELAQSPLWYLMLVGGKGTFLMSPNGALFIFAQGTVAINDGKWHHLVGTRDGSGNLTIYVDGVSVGTTTGGAQAFTASATTYIGGDGRFGNFMAGSVAEPAIYIGTALSPTRVGAHFTAGNGRVGDLTGTRIGWVLDHAGPGWPSALRNIDAGQDSMVAISAPVGALSLILDATTSENGITFISGSGKVTFYERDHVLKPPFTTSQATFGDGALPYSLPQTELALDELDIYGTAAITPSGGAPVIISDSTSGTQYIPRSLTKSLLTASQLTAIDAANWEVAHYRQPYQRIRAITIDALSSPATMWPQMLGRELWDRVTVQRNAFPVEPGSAACTPFSQVYLIESIEHTWKPGYWQTKFGLSPAETQSYLVLDDSTLGRIDSTPVLAY